MRSKKARPPAPSPWLWFLLGGALLLAALVGLSLNNNPANSNGTPQLNVSDSAIDLGEVKLGQWVSASFQVTNTGTGTLHFQEAPYIEVAAGC